MNTRIKTSIISLSLLLLTSCGLHLRFYSREQFTEQTTLTISNDEDPIGTVRELKYCLAAEGFNVVSLTTAANALKFKEPIGSDKNEELQKIFSIKDINSVYALNLYYLYNKCSLDDRHYTYRRLTLNVINLNTGEIIMRGFYVSGGNKNMKKILKDVAQKLHKQVKKQKLST